MPTLLQACVRLALGESTALLIKSYRIPLPELGLLVGAGISVNPPHVANRGFRPAEWIRRLHLRAHYLDRCTNPDANPREACSRDAEQSGWFSPCQHVTLRHDRLTRAHRRHNTRARRPGDNQTPCSPWPSSALWSYRGLPSSKRSSPPASPPVLLNVLPHCRRKVHMLLRPKCVKVASAAHRWRAVFVGSAATSSWHLLANGYGHGAAEVRDA